MVRFGLREKKSGKVLGYSVVANDPDGYCGAVSYTLEAGEDPIWLVDHIEDAEYVRRYSTEWFNAGYESPEHNFKPEDLEVVEVELVVTPAKTEGLFPTMNQYVDVHYAKDPTKEHMRQQFKKDGWQPSVYDIRSYFLELEKTKK